MACMLWCRPSYVHWSSRNCTRVTRASSVAKTWPAATSGGHQVDKDLETQVKLCRACQQQRASPARAPLHSCAWPSRRWQRVHLDFVGPFRNWMFLVAVDAHSKWPEVCLMKFTTAATTVAQLHKLFSRHGLPETIVSDNGPQFTSEEFCSFRKLHGMRQVLTAPYYSSSNGLAGRFIQSLKNALRKAPAS